MLAVTLTLLANALLVQCAPAQAGTLTLTPDADAWVSNATPNTNRGTAQTLEIGGFGSANDRRTYLRFSGTIPAGTVVTRTTLRLYFDTAPSGAFDLRLATPVNSPWDEGTLTWNTPPPAQTGPVSGNITSIAPGYNDVSAPLLSSGSPITYILTRTEAVGAQIQSKENVNRPQLVVEYEMPSTTPTSVCSAGGCVESRPWLTTHSWAITVADFNGDGRDDHLITRHEANQDQIWLQQLDGSFAPGFHLDNADRHGCTAGDVNGDGRIDFYCMVGADGGEGLGQKNNELWISQGNGTYVDQAAAWGVTDAFGRGRRPLLFDFSRDGKPDLYITNFAPGPGGASGNILYINAGDHFEERTVSASGDKGTLCVDDADWDRDGYLDFLVCGAELNLFHNSGPTGVTEQRNFLLGSPVPFPLDATLADLNGDSWPDLVLVRKTELQIRLNAGPGNPTTRFPVSFTAPLIDGKSVSVGDLTDDGFADLYVVEGEASGPNGFENAPDKLFLGPNWVPDEIPQAEFGGGDDSEFINILGRRMLIVTNGRDYTRGPVQFISFISNSYPRPVSASKLQMSLVPAFKECVAPDRQHGPPLASDSCASPTGVSDFLTVGTPAQSVGTVLYKVFEGNPSTPENEADVRVRVRLTDVRRKSDLSDYTGELQVQGAVRVTDKNNGPQRNEAATVSDTAYPMAVPCMSTASATVGSTCSLTSTFNAIVPGTVVERKRAVWQLGQVQVFDGGPSEVAGGSGASLFATQGVFVP